MTRLPRSTKKHRMDSTLAHWLHCTDAVCGWSTDWNIWKGWAQREPGNWGEIQYKYKYNCNTNTVESGYEKTELAMERRRGNGTMVGQWHNQPTPTHWCISPQARHTQTNLIDSAISIPGVFQHQSGVVLFSDIVGVQTQVWLSVECNWLENP